MSMSTIFPRRGRFAGAILAFCAAAAFSAGVAAQGLAEGTHFAKGSMAPKIQAIINFLEAGGNHAIVTDPAHIPQALAGETGTHFTQ